MTRVGKFIEALFEEHKLVRRLMAIWAICLITYIVVKGVDTIKVIDTPASTFLIAIVGILATVTAFYIRSRELDDKRKDE